MRFGWAWLLTLALYVGLVGRDPRIASEDGEVFQGSHASD